MTEELYQQALLTIELMMDLEELTQEQELILLNLIVAVEEYENLNYPMEEM